MGKRLFISHSSSDKPFVNRLLRRLQEHGLDDAWYDVREIGPTSNLQKSMSEGVSSADYFAIVLSSSTALSQWVSFEIQQALNSTKPVLALMNAPASEQASWLASPFINQLLQGGQHKLLDFTTSFDEAVLSLIGEVAPEKGAELAIEERLRIIFEDGDPDVAERAMGFAALDAMAHIPGLLLRLGVLRDERRLRYRGERLCCHIGEELIDILFGVLTRQFALPEKPIAPPPAHVQAAVDSPSQSVLTGAIAMDWMRWISLNPVAQQWSNQLGAEYCLIALGKQNARLKSRIVAILGDWLVRMTSLIADQRNDENAFDSGFFDGLRLTIEVAGELAPDPGLSPFLIHQFLTESLWGVHSDQAKGKLTSYVVEFLAKAGGPDSLHYLVSLVQDGSEEVQAYVRGNVSPNPFDHCFVGFGGAAVEPLLELLENHSPFTMGALKNLAAIPDPLANREVLKFLSNDIEPFARSELIWALAMNTVPETANALVTASLNKDSILHAEKEFSRERISAAIAYAVKFVSDPQSAERLVERQLADSQVVVASQAVQAAGSLGLFGLYKKLDEIFRTSTVVHLRAYAAVALARRDAISKDAIWSRLQFAEKQFELPLLSIALSYFDEAKAVPGLIKGLQDTFDGYNEELHDLFAAALARMTLDEAKAARQKWYKRR